MDDTNTTSENKHSSVYKNKKCRILKNIILISLAFTLTFTAYIGLSNLQSSLHTEDGLGTTSQAVLYSSIMIGCLLVPKAIINCFGHKWSMVISLIGYIIWDIANGHAGWSTMIPASLITGLGMAVLWASQGSYFNILAERYAIITMVSRREVVARWSGVLYFFYQISNMTGAVISSVIFMPDDNTTIDETSLQYCGAKDCQNIEFNVTAHAPSYSAVWILVAVYVTIAITGLLVMIICVDNIPTVLFKKRKVNFQESFQYATASFKHLRHTNQLLLIPITIYAGIHCGTSISDFTKSYITCSVGIWKVGYVLMPFGICNALSALTSGYLVKFTGRIPLFTLCFFTDMGKIIFLLLWMPNPDQEYVLFILASVCGLTEGIWRTHVRALYGILFSDKPEAAFSNYLLWESCGFTLVFVCSSLICTSTKLYIGTSFLSVGMLCYYLVEYLQIKSTKVMPETSKVDTLTGKISANNA